MAQQIQHRRGTAAQWTAAAPVLASGEIGFETDTGKFKVGDGATAWASLDYFDPNAGGDVVSVNAQTGVVVLDADDIDDSATTHKFTSAADAAKLDGIATGATANSSDATLLARANHTGTQAQSTVTDLVADLAAKAPLASPALTGTPTAPTAAPGTNTTQVATTAFVTAAGSTAVPAAGFWASQPPSSTSGGTWTLTSHASFYGRLYLGAGPTQDAQITWRLPTLEAGTYSLRLLHGAGAVHGIYTIETSTNGSAWTALTTVDGYSSSSNMAASSTVTGLTIVSGTSYIRMRMASKNASSSNYYAELSAVHLTRTA